MGIKQVSDVLFRRGFAPTPYSLFPRHQALITKMTQPEALKLLLSAVAAGEVSPDAALEKLKYLNFEPLEDFAKIDHHRNLRTGFPEAVWGEGKTPEQIARILEAMRDRHTVAIATRIAPDVCKQLKKKIPDLQYYPAAKICALANGVPLEQRHGKITILTAGTADIPVAEEAAITAELSGFEVQRLWDVGVAGIHRLLSNRHVIDQADVLIVVAGMEGALPSVVAGIADCPVIAVPTSIGYGVNFGGVAPLLTMLNSCAAGIGVVNINNGFGAAILAGQILRVASKFSAQPPQPQLPPQQFNPSPWKLVYAHDADGKRVSGDLNQLAEAVRQGQPVRFLIDFAGSHEYSLDAQHLWLKNGVVYAQNTSQLSVEFKGDVLALRKKGYQSAIAASTNGDLEIARFRLGKHKPKGRLFHKVAMRWFVS